MTPAAELLSEEIAHSGPIPFKRFMEVALYHPRHGYYLRQPDPFGKEGDFYTAEQMQPVFGLLMARYVEQLRLEAGAAKWAVVELGPGRGEMSEYFTSCDYHPVDVGDALPAPLSGVVFANEFFDALPVEVAVRRGEAFHLMRIGFEQGAFQWIEAEEISGRNRAYLDALARHVEDGGMVEINLDAIDWLDRSASILEDGFLLAIDYGYTSAELARFPRGTLMGYHRHRAIDDVLVDPGERDITAHVPFTVLEEYASKAGFTVVRRESLGRTLLRIGEEDDFACVLGAASGSGLDKRKLQLKSLMFGMGETFQTLLLRRNVGPEK